MLRWPLLKKQTTPNVRVLHESSLELGSSDYEVPVDKRITLSGKETLQAHQMRGRIWLVVAMFMLTFSGLALKLVSITQEGPQLQRLVTADNQTSQNVERPLILDRNNRRLAMNQKVTGAALNMKDVWDIDLTVDKLMDVFPDLEREKLVWRLENKKYVPLSEDLSPDERNSLKQLGLPGLEFP